MYTSQVNNLSFNKCACLCYQFKSQNTHLSIIPEPSFVLCTSLKTFALVHVCVLIRIQVFIFHIYSQISQLSAMKHLSVYGCVYFHKDRNFLFFTNPHALCFFIFLTYHTILFRDHKGKWLKHSKMFSTQQLTPQFCSVKLSSSTILLSSIPDKFIT